MKNEYIQKNIGIVINLCFIIFNNSYSWIHNLEIIKFKLKRYTMRKPDDFKCGDTVKCIANDLLNIEPSKVYLVRDVFYDKLLVGEGLNYYYMSDKFIKVIKSKEERDLLIAFLKQHPKFEYKTIIDIMDVHVYFNCNNITFTLKYLNTHNGVYYYDNRCAINLKDFEDYKQNIVVIKNPNFTLRNISKENLTLYKKEIIEYLQSNYKNSDITPIDIKNLEFYADNYLKLTTKDRMENGSITYNEKVIVIENLDNFINSARHTDQMIADAIKYDDQRIIDAMVKEHKADVKEILDEQNKINDIMFYDKIKRPPLGIIPKSIFERNTNIKRFNDICLVISNYYNAGLKIKPEWIEEYNELVDYICKQNENKVNE